MEISPEIQREGEGDQDVLNYIKDVSNTTINKQKYADDLKYDYEKVQLEVNQKLEELKKIRESNTSLKGFLNSHKYMMDELQKAEEGDNKEIAQNRENVQNLQNEMNKLKQIRNDDLAQYEEKVSNMTNKFIDGPFNCNPSLLSENMKKLMDIKEDVKKELKNILHDLECTYKKFNMEPLNSQPGIGNLIKEQEAGDEENIQVMSETETLAHEVNSLKKISNGLQEEIKVLKQHHNID